tara:strand:+ start:701 stop:1417 length:717 start_codon:yes stop_codon:yes gene_type:complete
LRFFYTPEIEGDVFQLPKDESRHIIQVLRLKEQDTLMLSDGKGCLYEAEILEAHPKNCTVKIITKHQVGTARNYQLHMVVAPTKTNDRFEFFIEKAVEIGVDRITPVICEHSERKNNKSERLLRVAVSALKQSRKAVLPIIDEPIGLNQLLEEIAEKNDAQKFIAHCEEDDEKLSLYNQLSEDASSVILLIGPEGDFSPEEIKQAKKAGCLPVSLGKSRLRTETAAIAACHTVNLKYE